jgi:hypothetical protein
MQLQYKYNDPKVKEVTERELMQVSGGNKKGFFKLNPDWNDPNEFVKYLTLKFEPVIYINKDLPKTPDTDKGIPSKAEVLKHEKQHNTDWKKLAEALKAAVDNALKKGKDAEINDRMAWFLYDGCVKSKNFHSSVKGYDVETCSQPTVKRPK